MDQEEWRNESLHSLFSLSDSKKDKALHNVLKALNQLEIAVENMAISLDEVDKVCEDTDSSDAAEDQPPQEQSTTNINDVNDVSNTQEQLIIPDINDVSNTQEIKDTQTNSNSDDGNDDGVLIIENSAMKDHDYDKKAVDAIEEELETQLKRTSQFLPSFESFQKSVKNQKFLPQIKIQDKTASGDRIPSSTSDIISEIKKTVTPTPLAIHTMQKVSRCTSDQEFHHKPMQNIKTGPAPQQKSLECGGSQSSTQWQIAKISGKNVPQPSTSGRTLANKSLINKVSSESPLRNALQAKTILHQTKMKTQSRRAKRRTPAEKHKTHLQNTVMSLNTQNTRKRIGRVDYLSTFLTTNLRRISNILQENNSRASDNMHPTNTVHSTMQNEQVSVELRRRLAEPNTSHQSQSQAVVSHTGREMQVRTPLPFNPAEQGFQGYGASFQNFMTNAEYLNFSGTENRSLVSCQNHSSCWSMQRNTLNYDHYNSSDSGVTQNSEEGNFSGYQNIEEKPDHPYDPATPAIYVSDYDNQFRSQFETGQQNNSDNEANLQIKCDSSTNGSEYAENQENLSEATPAQQIRYEAGQQIDSEFETDQIKSEFYSTESDSNYAAGSDYGTYQQNAYPGQTHNFNSRIGQNTYLTYGTGAEAARIAENDGPNIMHQRFYFPLQDPNPVDVSDWEREQNLQTPDGDENADTNECSDSSAEAEAFSQSSSTHSARYAQHSSSDENVQNSYSGDSQPHSPEYDNIFDFPAPPYGAAPYNNFYPASAGGFGRGPIWIFNNNTFTQMDFVEQRRAEMNMMNPWFYQ